MPAGSGTLLGSLTPVKLEPYEDPQSARTVALEFVPSQTIARGTLIAQRTSDAKATLYAAAHTDGTENPVGPLVYDIVVDSNGLIVYGPSGATVDLTRGFERTAPVYHKGTFLESELTGLDSTAVSALGREMGIGTSYKCLKIL